MQRPEQIVPRISGFVESSIRQDIGYTLGYTQNSPTDVWHDKTQGFVGQAQYPVGIKDTSRGLSEATPPVRITRSHRPRQGSQNLANVHLDASVAGRGFHQYARYSDPMTRGILPPRWATNRQTTHSVTMTLSGSKCL